jgi:hypothetical protein
MWKHSLVWLLLTTALSPAAPQAAAELWDNLRELKPGEDIEVVDARMKSYRGRFTRYTAGTIALNHQGGDLQIARTDVASVKRRSRPHRGRNVLLGLAIGAAGGLAVGAVTGKTYHEEGETPVFIAVWTPIGAGIGAAVGAALPARSEVTVYRARSIAGR